MKTLTIDKRILKNLDYILLITVVIIVAFGLANIYSSTHTLFKFEYFKLQLLWFVMGLVILYIFFIIDYNVLSTYSLYIYWAGIFLLLVTVVGSKAIKGASSWIAIGNRAFEPGEFVRFGLILMLAKKLDDMDGNINNLKNFCILFFYAIIPMILILLQPNLGMTLIYFFITLAIFFIAELNLKALIGGLLSLIPISFMVWNSNFLKVYQKDRIISFLSPETHTGDTAFQLTQSLIGIGSGNIFGKGFLKGTQVSGGYIPEIHTDFIFSAVGEEWGIIGAVALLFLYGILIYRILKIGKNSKNKLGSYICVGIAASFIFSVLQNIGMTIGIMPIAGITLPFMSYGGSSLASNFILLGLVLNVGMRYKKINF